MPQENGFALVLAVLIYRGNLGPFEREQACWALIGGEFGVSAFLGAESFPIKYYLLTISSQMSDLGDAIRSDITEFVMGFIGW